jgi:hypothetical protein
MNFSENTCIGLCEEVGRRMVEAMPSRRWMTGGEG